MNYLELRRVDELKRLPTPFTGGSNSNLKIDNLPDYLRPRLAEQISKIPTPVTGKGLLNVGINNLPFEMHMPGYNFLGPGTKLEKRLRNGTRPTNKLDELAMNHDIAYSKSKNLKDRHEADYILQEGAWNRVKSRDASLGEKAVAWLTTNAMKAKRALGAGILTKFPVSLATDQQKKLATAVQKQKGVTLKINTSRTKESVMNESYLPLTRVQIKNLKKGKKSIKLSAVQVKKIKTGGFLPALLAAAPVVAGVVSTIANAYNNKKSNDRLLEERIRHDKAMEELQKHMGKGVYINKKPSRGKGVYINKKPKGNGVYINKKPKGNGVYINKRPKGSGVYINKKPKGNGLLEQLLKKKKDTPLSNIELTKYAIQLQIPYFRGVFMRDCLPKRISSNESAIVNLDSSSGPGTHWVAYAKRGNHVEYYDSFGVAPPAELSRYFGKKADVIYNYDQDQQLSQVICGHLCLKFLHKYR